MGKNKKVGIDDNLQTVLDFFEIDKIEDIVKVKWLDPNKKNDIAAFNAVKLAPINKELEKLKRANNIHQLFTKHLFSPSSNPIEYKKIIKARFKGFKWKKTNSVKLTSSNKLNIKDGLVKINQKRQDTTVLNIGTGKGKTTLVYNYISQIVNSDANALVILCSPFLSIVEKDYNTLIKPSFKLNQNDVVNFLDVNNFSNNYSYKNVYGNYSNPTKDVLQFITNKRVHVLTANCFLGNPGEDAFNQKPFKKLYVSGILDYAKANELNVHLIFDEIHASIINFKSEFIYNLLRWQEVVTKCIVSSATMTEAVFPILKHLAYLTNDSIHLIELDRTKSLTPADLDVFFSKTDSVDYTINQLLVWLSHHGYLNSSLKKFHIICWSKKLAEQVFLKIHSVVKNSPNVVLNKVIGSTNQRFKFIFDSSKCNIGTTFSTGIDILNPDDALVVLPPPKNASKLGIFTSGVPSILQAMGRLRNGGKILLFIPPLSSVIDDNNTKVFLNFYLSALGITPQVIQNKSKHKNFEHEFNILDKHFTKKNIERLTIAKQYNKSITKAANGLSKNGRPNIINQALDNFIIQRGQDYLVYSSFKSGKKVLPFLLWSALQNQFVDSNLNALLIEKTLNKPLSLTRHNFANELTQFLNSTDIKNINSVARNSSDKVLFDLLKTNTSLTKINKVSTKVDCSYEDQSGNTIQLGFKKKLYNTVDGREYLLSFMSHLRSSTTQFIDVKQYLNYRLLLVQLNPSSQLDLAYTDLKLVVDDFFKKFANSNIPSKGNDFVNYPSIVQFFNKSRMTLFESSIMTIRNKDYFLKGSRFQGLNNNKYKNTIELYNAFIITFFETVRGSRKGTKSSGKKLTYCKYSKLTVLQNFPFV